MLPVLEPTLLLTFVSPEFLLPTEKISTPWCFETIAPKDTDPISNALLKYGGKRVILIAFGPTATLLAYDWYKLGYQSVDVGNIEIEFDWILWNATHTIQIKNKYVNEALGKRYNFTYVKDNNNYYNQIVEKILK